MKNKVSEWLSSNGYMDDIACIQQQIIDRCSKCRSEADVASVFETELYIAIRTNTGESFSFQKEKPVNNVVSHRIVTASSSIGTGRLDAVVNNLVIEYKKPKVLDSHRNVQKAFIQVEDYLNALYQNEGKYYSAVLTDGTRIAFFNNREGGLDKSNLLKIQKEHVDLIIKAIIANSSKKIETKNILSDFAIHRNGDSISKRIAQELYTILCNNPTDKTEMLYSEWQHLMHLSGSDNDGKSNDIQKRRKDLELIFSKPINNSNVEYRALFALQTTYAIIVKLLACKIVDKVNYDSETMSYSDLSLVTDQQIMEFLAHVEDGYNYQSSNIYNFLEGDFFSWYCDKLQWTPSLGKLIHECLITIEEYSAFSFNIRYRPIDVFKDLYMCVIPKSFRHSMGEYFTPHWLANRVVVESLKLIKNEEWKAVDPCCGSGIFLLSLIKEIVGDANILEMSIVQRRKMQEAIVDRVYGVDINPLSVLSARVGYYFALIPFGSVENIEIPIFLGDSAIVPKIVQIDGVDCYKYSVSNSKYPIEAVLPVSFVKSHSFSETMYSWQDYIKAENESLLTQRITSKLDKKALASKDVLQHITELSKDLVYLHKQNWDGIWVRILTNYMLIARMSDFDLIVGNPPWVKWEHLPTAYARQIKEFCDVRHIFCNDGGQYGGTQLNICALIANVTAANWLAKDGVLAFLMPDSIMSQNSYEEFRNFYIDYSKGERLYLQRIDKWESPLRPFRYEDKAVTQDFNTYYYSRKKVDYQKGISVTCISKEPKVKIDVNGYDTYEDIKGLLKTGKTVAKQLSPSSTAFSYSSSLFDFTKIIGTSSYLYRTGVEFTPQQLFMLTGAGSSNKKDHYRFKNKNFALSKYRITDAPKAGWDFPTELIYPIVTSPSMTPFRYEDMDDYCILPYEKENLKTTIGPEALAKKCPELLRYFLKYNELINQQSEKSKVMHRGADFYALSKLGPYTFAKNIVAARDNTSFCAAVINQKQTPWGEVKQTICVKHTIIISQRVDKKFITKDEAYYVCGILNSDIVREYMHKTFKSNGFSLKKAHLYLPLYDANNEHHKTIVKLAKLASETAPENLEKITKEITSAYLEICLNKD